MLDLLRTLSMKNAPSGFEDEVRAYIEETAKKYADEVFIDALGNVLAFKKGKRRPAKRIMLLAHMDEVGFIIKRITEDGLLKFEFIGGMLKNTIVSKKVLIGKQRIPGIVGLKAVHLGLADEQNHFSDAGSLYIDIGAQTQQEAEKVVSVGDFGVFDAKFIRLSDRAVSTKAIDDRAGCAVLLKLIKEELPYDAFFAFTVMEEIGCRGAMAAAYAVKPEIALVVEGTPAADVPGVLETRQIARLEKGPALTVIDAVTIHDDKLLHATCEKANQKNIPWQYKAYTSGATDSSAVQIANAGARVLTAAVPVRYAHAPCGMASIKDLDALYLLSKEFITIAGEETK